MIKSKPFPYSVLYIEDQFNVRKKYMHYFKQNYIKVYEADSGKKALELYNKYKPEIIICDINLPDISGLEVLKTIRMYDYKTRVIMLTAYSDNEKLFEAVKLKLTDYLIKPVSRKQLIEALELVHKEYDCFDIVLKKRLLFKENYWWDCQKQILYCHVNEVALTPNERKLVKLFCENTNIILSYDDMIVNIWDDYEEDKYNAIKILLKNLRKKLPLETIKNIYGEGYSIKLL